MAKLKPGGLVVALDVFRKAVTAPSFRKWAWRPDRSIGDRNARQYHHGCGSGTGSCRAKKETSPRGPGLAVVHLCLHEKKQIVYNSTCTLSQTPARYKQVAP